MNTTVSISVAKAFTTTPGGRYRSEGEFSGEQFREDVLLPAFQEAVRESAILAVDLDGVAGYATSFLEEAFGGLVRVIKIRGTVPRHLKLVSENPLRIREVESYITDAESGLGNG